MSNTNFRDKVKAYLRAAGIAQKQLARELGLTPTTLSHKLNATDNMRVTEAEVLRVVKLLAGWQAIHRREQAEELLGLMEMQPTAFSADEWQSAPLNSLDAATPPPDEPHLPLTLPLPLNRLIGRESLLDALSLALNETETRLLTLTGPGGVGKTRLVVEVGRLAYSQFTDGVVFVALASLNDPQLVASEIAHQFQLRPDAHAPVIETIKLHVAARHLLLILDNFEHVLEASSLIPDLLEAAPSLKIIVTSRVRLNLPSERLVEVPPLALPDAQQLDDWSQQPAIALFVARAQTVRSEFQLTSANAPSIAEICVRLDGLPLALELAAARIRLFSPQSLLARLNEPLALLTTTAANVSPRQATLSATIAWSYLLLEADEQHLFLALSLFPAGCTLEALQAVVADDEAHALKVADGAASLLDKSLIQQREGKDQRTRYTMLQTLRDYASEQITANTVQHDSLHQRQTDYYVALVKHAATQFTGANRVTTLDWLEAEIDNLRAVLKWTVDHQQHARIILVANLGQLWSQRGYTSEGQRWLSEALAQRWQDDDTAAHKSDYGLAFNSAGVLDFIAGDYAQAKNYFEQAVALRREINDLEGLSSTYNNLGNLMWNQSDLASAKQYFESAVEISEELNKHALTASILNNLGSLLQGQGDLEGAEKALTRALTIWRDLGNQQSIANALSNLGMVSFDRGQFDQASAYYAESLPLQVAVGNQRNVAAVMSNMAELALQRGEYDEAQRLFEDTLRLQTEVNYQWGMGSATCDLGRVAFFRGEYGTALARLNEALVILRPLEDVEKISFALEALGMTAFKMADKAGAMTSLREALALRANRDDESSIASTLACMAAVYAATREPLRGAVLWGAAFGIWDKIGRKPPPTQRKLFEQELHTARVNTDPGDFDRAWQTGLTIKLKSLSGRV